MVMDIPEFVMFIIERLRAGGHEAYVVGGAVRDFCRGRPAGDWDIATSARPDEIEAVFENVRSYSLKHETVTLVSGEKGYEVSSFRGVRLGGEGLEGDLAHRDFTINAMAYDPAERRIIDPFGGRHDIIGKRIKAVGNPSDRFHEDPLRMFRGVRLAAELGFRIEPATGNCIQNMAHMLRGTAKERIRDELLKLLMSPRPAEGIRLMKRLGLLAFVIPELLESVGVRQNPQYHRFTVFRHILETVHRADPEPVIRLAALLHDIAKPRAREKIAGKYRFYGHAKASAALAREILERLKFGKDTTERVVHLIECHMRDLDYRSDWSDGAVRRLIRSIGEENIRSFLSFRRADLLAHGVMDEKMALFAELGERIEKLLEIPFPKRAPDLAIDGHKVMEVLHLEQGPEVGRILALLMEKVIDDPQLNTEESLIAVLNQI
ncbi:MAG: CCA tRNA nucleotidyltransferase [Desulfobacteraceae bacterium]|nr:MAG: CCA tRNA nucleotidyltransferase [Desulfobacteraceae bacterium]